MRIGWKAYLRSGQVIEFTAEHDAIGQKVNDDASSIEGASPWVIFYRRYLECLAHDSFKLAGSAKITKAEYDVAYEEALSQLDKTSNYSTKQKKEIARCMAEDTICAKCGVRLKNLKPSTEGDGSYILSWPDHVTARC